MILVLTKPKDKQMTDIKSTETTSPSPVDQRRKASARLAAAIEAAYILEAIRR